MTGRSVPEWVGSSPDAKIPRAVYARVFERFNGICQLSKRKIGAGEPWDLDHIRPLSMHGEHRESNLHPVLRDKHREKTAAEAGQRAKADRVRAKHLGIHPKPQGNNRLQSRPFPTTNRSAWR